MTESRTAIAAALGLTAIAAALYLTGSGASAPVVAPVPVEAPGPVEAPDPGWQRQIDALRGQLADQAAAIARLEAARAGGPGPRGHDPDRHEQRIGALEFDRYGGK